MNPCPDVQPEQHKEEHGEDEVQLQPYVAPALEKLVRADRVLQVRHGFGNRGDLTDWPAGLNPEPQRRQACCQQRRLRQGAQFRRQVFERAPRTIQVASRSLQEQQLVFDLLGFVAQQITTDEPTYDDEQHHCRQRDSEPTVELVAGMNNGQQRAEDA